MSEENCEVHGRCPFSGVSLDVELAASTVDFADNSLNGEGCSFGWFFILVELQHVLFAVISRAFDGRFQHGGHELGGRNVVIFGLRSGDFRFCGSGYFCERDLLGFFR